MSYNRENSNYVVNEEQIGAYLADIVTRIEKSSNNDIEALDTIKKLIKKNVPFSRRKLVFAYLIKNSVHGYRPNKNFDRSSRFERGDKRESRNESRSERYSKNENNERQERAPRVQIDPSLAKTIFIGVGRNRRVFPRDLVGLLVNIAGLDRERIGEIRVLANYSFIQLFSEDCEKAIAALNNYEYRGRKLSVSYSKQRDENSPAEDYSPAEEKSAVSESVLSDEGINDEPIPANVTNESSGIAAAEVSEEAKIAQAQTEYAKAVEAKPYAETTDDGQVKSHFGDGAAY